MICKTQGLNFCLPDSQVQRVSWKNWGLWRSAGAVFSMTINSIIQLKHMASPNLPLVNKTPFFEFNLLYFFRLPHCRITEIGCGFLAKALMSNPTKLKELDLSYNHPGQQGMELLSCVQRDIERLTIRYNTKWNATSCFWSGNYFSWLFTFQMSSLFFFLAWTTMQSAT